MDKLKGMAEKAMHSGGSGNTSSTGNTGATQGSSGKEDYGDKGTYPPTSTHPISDDTVL